MKPDDDRNVHAPAAVSAALDCLEKRCQDVREWVSHPIPLGTPQALLIEALITQSDWVLWRGRAGRVLIGVGVTHRQSLTNWHSATQAAPLENTPPPFTFFGGGFDPHHSMQSQAWQGWPGIELYVPAVVLEWKDRADAMPQVWTQHDQYANAHSICRGLATAHSPRPPLSEVSQWTPVESFDSWSARIEHLHRQFKNTSLEKVVMARSARDEVTMNDERVLTALQSLLDHASDDIVFAVHRKNSLFVGCTPETLADLDDGWIATHALAGTQTDDQSESEFLSNEKIGREHRSVVNDVCSKLKTMSEDVIVQSPRLRYAKSLVHLETKIRAKVSQAHLLDVVAQLHPTPALGGSPTPGALEWLRENEALDRGWFGGPIGWFNSTGAGRCAVAIRSALLTEEGSIAFAGAGIVSGSDPVAEWQETTDKLGSILSVFNGVIQ